MKSCMIFIQANPQMLFQAHIHVFKIRDRISPSLLRHRLILLLDLKPAEGCDLIKMGLFFNCAHNA